MSCALFTRLIPQEPQNLTLDSPKDAGRVAGIAGNVQLFVFQAIPRQCKAWYSFRRSHSGNPGEACGSRSEE